MQGPHDGATGEGARMEDVSQVGVSGVQVGSHLKITALRSVHEHR